MDIPKYRAASSLVSTSLVQKIVFAVIRSATCFNSSAIATLIKVLRCKVTMKKQYRLYRCIYQYIGKYIDNKKGGYQTALKISSTTLYPFGTLAACFRDCDVFLILKTSSMQDSGNNISTPFFHNGFPLLNLLSKV